MQHKELDVKRVDTVLFDLDGTLLPMEQEAFTQAYFQQLGQKAAPLGYDPKALVAAVWAGTKAMMKNDGSQKNVDCFWSVFCTQMGEEARALQPVFDRFYQEEFHRVKAATGENALAAKLVRGLARQGKGLVVATNPVFPLVGNHTRLSWVGLKAEQFLHITAYENASYCKPSLGYYQEILKTIGKTPEQCLMVGNDGVEDLAAADLGMQVFLVTDCLINAQGVCLTEVPHGSFSQLCEVLGE